jgi:Uma2 family endonuclease
MTSTLESANESAHSVRLPPAIPHAPVYRFSAEQYDQMIRAGILAEDEPVEFLEGWLIPKMTKNPPHDSTIRTLVRLLQGLTGNAWDIHSQSVLDLGASKPEPDVLVVRHDADDYVDRHPTPPDVAIVIEVAEASLSRDRAWKKRLYAQAGISEYWIVNLIDSVIEVYSEVSAEGYGRQTDYLPEQSVPVSLDGELLGSLLVDHILP